MAYTPPGGGSVGLDFVGPALPPNGGDVNLEFDVVNAKAKQVGGTVLAEMQDAYNGVKVQVSGTEIGALAAVPGVKAVHAVQVHHLDNAVSVPYLGVDQVWQDTGFTGKGIKVGIIDTGIDYTHADFAGPGTVAAYEAAKARQWADLDGNLLISNDPYEGIKVIDGKVTLADKPGLGLKALQKLFV